jgi:hypothetical protein
MIQPALRVVSIVRCLLGITESGQENDRTALPDIVVVRGQAGRFDCRADLGTLCLCHRHPYLPDQACPARGATVKRGIIKKGPSRDPIRLWLGDQDYSPLRGSPLRGRHRIRADVVSVD